MNGECVAYPRMADRHLELYLGLEEVRSALQVVVDISSDWYMTSSIRRVSVKSSFACAYVCECVARSVQSDGVALGEASTSPEAVA
ncbi:unnamed protein product [Nippostrongylus brasiliensis]|uniref:DUF5753 domain-containing protein n=1 Tax=Nippostrongylus brasiliensis TaxID=27835 RepID=A0A0N4YJQ2_NIPBR|nr:unnamed protein product [Nippostrongylus brasiliensis]